MESTDTNSCAQSCDNIEVKKVNAELRRLFLFKGVVALKSICHPKLEPRKSPEGQNKFCPSAEHPLLFQA